MKMTKKALASAIAVSGLAFSAVAPTAQAVEVDAAIGAANMYYWRGLDLGGGAAVWGELSLSAGGFYGGLWTSSGDELGGVEYDLFVGYGQEFGDFSVDISLWTYAYPSPKVADSEPGLHHEFAVSPGDLVELVLGLGYGPVTLTYYHGLEDLEDYSYVTLGAEFGQFGLLLGHHMDEDGFGSIDGLTHLDLTYAYNDNLSFTLGLVVDDAKTTATVGGETLESKFNSEPKFIVSFSLPIEF